MVIRTPAQAHPFSELISGPGGRQILLADPAGNLIDLIQPARRPQTAEPSRS